MYPLLFFEKMSIQNSIIFNLKYLLTTWIFNGGVCVIFSHKPLFLICLVQRQRVRLQRRRLRAPVEPMQRETRLQRRLGRDRLRSRYGRQKPLPQRISGHRKRKRRHGGKHRCTRGVRKVWQKAPPHSNCKGCILLNLNYSMDFPPKNF